MKYFTLGLVSAVTAADFLTQIDTLVNSVWTPTENGGIIDLAPYATFSFDLVDDMAALEGHWHPLGLEENRFNSQFVVDYSGDDNSIVDITSVQHGHWSQYTPEMLFFFQEILGLPNFIQPGQDAYVLTDNLTVSGDTTGFGIGGTSVLDVEDGASTAEWNTDLSTSLEISANDVTVLVDLTVDSMFNGFSDEIVAATSVGPLEVNFSVSGPQTCSPTSRPPCDYESTIVYSGPEFNGDGEFSTSVSIKPKAVIVNWTLGDGQTTSIVARSENLRNKAVNWKKELYLGLYYMENRDMPLAAIANDLTTLVVRVPLSMSIATKVLPAIFAKAEPWLEFGTAMVMKPETIPNLAMYVDKFLLTLDGDVFDCSEIVRTSAIESDIIADLLEVDSLNQWMVQGCQAWNESVMEAIQDSNIDYHMDNARDYLRTLLSQEGEDVYEATYGHIF